MRSNRMHDELSLSLALRGQPAIHWWSGRRFLGGQFRRAQGQKQPGRINRIQKGPGVADPHPPFPAGLPIQIGELPQPANGPYALGGHEAVTQRGVAGHLAREDGLRRIAIAEKIIRIGHDAHADEVVWQRDIPEPTAPRG